MKPIVVNVAPERGRKPKPAPPGRICNDPDCSTQLTRYNSGDLCFVHRAPRRRGVRGAPGRGPSGRS
jgi:hypothetical protein